MFAFEENAIHRPLGLKLCQEFMSDVLQRMRRASPPSTGTIHSSESGLKSCPLADFTKTMKRPSGLTFGNALLFPLSEAPAMGTGSPPRPSSKGIRYRSYRMGVSLGSLGKVASGTPGV